MKHKKKVLLLGMAGMAGHVIYKTLTELNKFEVIGTSHRELKNQKEHILLNVTNFNEVEKTIKEVKPDYVINAVGVLIKGSQSASDNAILINSYLPHFLERICFNQGSKFIHISTDCVFSGNGHGGYKEDSFRDADDVYGRSKALGEINTKNSVTIRTSIIGPELKDNGEGLFHWFMSQDGEINGFTKVYWSGVTTLELAHGIVTVLKNNITGIYHLTNNNKISKYDLLCLFKDIWKKEKIQVTKKDNFFKDKSFINTLHPDFIVSKSYKQMLIEQYEFMNKYKLDFNYNVRYKI
ncbi:dTDP-4-dehydrorhamnose reductase family protein [Mesoflavibacter zeaxanthinifaciens]|uniref:dTDP-4-dehydrorhamnose reductase family protein n=1 Tax=Mesoflavibacter zeaxanthinifaciens TaxID=393060 RepID=UPI00056034CA|nr:SDR family oxidoreductase [Mesoflavibacter zeaxanthinifaciens]